MAFSPWTLCGKFFSFVGEFWAWMYHRLPRLFSFTFAALLGVYFIIFFPTLAYVAIPFLIANFLKLTAWLIFSGLDLVLKPFNPNSAAWLSH